MTGAIDRSCACLSAPYDAEYAERHPAELGRGGRGLELLGDEDVDGPFVAALLAHGVVVEDHSSVTQLTDMLYAEVWIPGWAGWLLDHFRERPSDAPRATRALRRIVALDPLARQLFEAGSDASRAAVIADMEDDW